MFIGDPGLIEAVSWRLASELVRRHPGKIRLFRGHPAGGQYDLLWLQQLPEGAGDIRLNRNGTIQIHGSFNAAGTIDWKPTEWQEYLACDAREFLEKLERAAGLKAPGHTPKTTPEVLTYRILAFLASTSIKTVHPIGIEQGYIDTSGDGGGPNEILGLFDIPEKLTRNRPDDFWGKSGYRFWIAVQDQKPFVAIEQSSATAWFPGSKECLDLMKVYSGCKSNIAITALRLRERAFDPTHM